MCIILSKSCSKNCFSCIIFTIYSIVLITHNCLNFSSHWLNVPGEYVCVEDNGEVIFSYIPPGDEPNSKVIMSNIEQMITLSGASNIKFQGLKFQHASQGGKDGYRWGEESVLRILKSSDITIEDCEFSHLGSIGIHFKQSSNILIQNNVFNDIGYHAISSLFNSFAETQENIMIR